MRETLSVEEESHGRKEQEHCGKMMTPPPVSICYMLASSEFGVLMCLLVWGR